jgi:hypothetical protein
MISYQFVLASGLASGLIQMFGGGTQTLGFSHVDVVLPPGLIFGGQTVPVTGQLFGARSDEVGGRPAGVQRRPVGYGNASWIRRTIFTLSSTPAQEAAFYAFLYAQEGKPYDKTAIIAFAADRDWRAEDSWFCDELAAAATEASLLCPALYLPANKLTPTGWAVVVSALGAVIRPQPLA